MELHHGLLGVIPGAVHTYHDGTKHHFHRFARSLGYLDWASQPNPFRSFAGAAEYALHPRPDAAGSALQAAQSGLRPFESLRVVPSNVEGRGPQAALSLSKGAIHTPVSAIEIGDILRHSLGLSAWKEFRESRWSLRVNPSSGNLHPTEAYVVAGPLAGVSDAPAVYHYAPDRHALEQRCAFDPAAWTAAIAGNEGAWLIALTSIHWVRRGSTASGRSGIASTISGTPSPPSASPRSSPAGARACSRTGPIATSPRSPASTATRITSRPSGRSLGAFSWSPVISRQSSVSSRQSSIARRCSRRFGRDSGLVVRIS